MSLEIIMGPMFSGKTTHAISFIRRQKFIGNSILALKPMIDTRYSSDAKIVSHNKEEVSCLLWDHNKSLEFKDEFLSVNSIIIEEAQFFKGLLDFIKIALPSLLTGIFCEPVIMGTRRISILSGIIFL